MRKRERKLDLVWSGTFGGMARRKWLGMETVRVVVGVGGGTG